MEKQVMWAVFGPDGTCEVWTLSEMSREARKKVAFMDWKSLYREGYRCKKVEITIKPI